MRKRKKMMIRYFTKRVFVVFGVLLVGALGVVYSVPVRQVSLEAGLGLEFRVNVFGLVLDVEGIDDASKAFLSDSVKYRLVNQSLKVALNQSINDMRKKNVFVADVPVSFVVGVSGDDARASALVASDLRWMIREKVGRLGWQGVEVEAFVLTPGLWSEAERLGLAPGRYFLIDRLASFLDLPEGVTFSYEDYASLSVYDLLALEAELLMPPVAESVVVAQVDVVQSSSGVVSVSSSSSKSASTVVPAPAPVASAPAAPSASSGLDGITSASPTK